MQNLILALEALERESTASQARAEALEVAGIQSERRARELELDKQAFIKLTYDFEFLKNLLEEKEKRVQALEHSEARMRQENAAL